MAAYIPASLIAETLATPPTQGKRLLEPLKAFSAQHRAPVNMLEDKDVKNDAEIHHHEADLWYCLEGEVTFICGGEMVNPWVHTSQDGTENPNEIKAKEIAGGTEYVLRAGDWLHVPAGEPHQHMCSGTARLIIIKIPKT